MITPSQGLICKACGDTGNPHKNMKGFCVPCGKHRQAEYTRAYRLRLKADPKPVVCNGCGNTFTTDKAGRKWRCPDCTRQYMAEYAIGYKERAKHRQRAFRNRHRDRLRAELVERRRKAIASMTPEELAEFRLREAEKTKRLNAALKDEVFKAYGGWKCRCCGETERSFLTIDHMENNGSKMRREGVHGHSAQFYRWLKKSNFPEAFQVLCMNCQFGKRMNGGNCPHQARCND
jgi:DNA-directed RNA polymerase subunit RPC12/RpoP